MTIKEEENIRENPQAAFPTDHFLIHSGVILLSIVLYSSIFYLIFSLTKSEIAMILSIIPVIIAAWFWGKTAGVITAVISSLLTILLIYVIDPSFSGISIYELISLLIGCIIIGFLIGNFGRLNQNLRLEIADLKKIEAELGDRELKHRTLVNMIPDMIYKIDSNGHFKFVNNSVQSLGYEPSELIGEHFSKIIHPDDLPKVSRKSVLPKYLGKITGDEGSPKLFDERRSGKRMTRGLEVRFVGKDWKKDDPKYMIGTLISYGEVTALGEYDSSVNSKDKQFLGTVGIVRDITERKKDEEELQKHRTQLEELVKERTAELEKANEELRQSQKMEAIGLLAGGIAHDFNNMLASILGYADMIKRNFTHNKPKLEKYASGIVDAAQRAADLTTKLLAFARKGKFEIVVVNMHEAIHDAIGLLERTIDKNINIIQHLSANPPTVRGDRAQLQNIVLNLAVNARDAMPKGGELIFATEVIELEDKYIKAHPYHIIPGTYLMFSVTDTGIGMDKKIRERVFEPFFTTKEIGKGTGLGLASVYGTVKNHNGSIEIYSEPGKGTAIKVYLPIVDEPVEKPRATLESIQKGTGNILVIDDEEFIRDIASEMLSYLGYTVSLCKEGEEAVDYYKNHYNEIDLVIIDLVMPKLGGYDCFIELKKINPEVKAIVSSGFALNGEAKKIVDHGALGFIQKPFDMGRLSKLVNKAINKI